MKLFSLTCLILGGAFAAADAGAQTLERVDVGGGVLAPPAAHGDYLYVGTGTTISAWNMADTAHPVLAGRTGSTPTSGPIRGMVVVGERLYAAWESPSEAIGGIAIYSLAAPATPVLIANYDDYTLSGWKRPQGLAAAGNHLYLGDSENGVIVIDIADPEAPVARGTLPDIHDFDGGMAVFGTQLVVSGSNFLGTRMVIVSDVTDPDEPSLLGFVGMDGGSVLRTVLGETHAIGVGNDLRVYDMRNPFAITEVFSSPIDLAVHGALVGDVLYLVGYDAIQVWDFADPTAPTLLRTVPAPSFMADQVTDTPFGPVVLTRADRGLLLDATQPDEPTIAAQFTLPFGSAAHAVGFDGAHAFIAQNVYGFSRVDAATLAPIGRYDADLPLQPGQRAFEDIAVDSGRAYLASWGYGVLIADLADPQNPVELGRFPFPFAGAIEAHGDRVYVVAATNGGVFGILDVANPAAPQLLGSLDTSATYDLAVRGTHAWLVDGSSFGEGGLRVVDVANPASPVVVGRYTDCGDAGGIDVSADGSLAYIACSDGSLRILDTSNRSQPVLLGSLMLPGGHALPNYNTAHSVVVAGGMAYVGNDYGIDEIDVTDPATPVRVARHETHYSVRKVERAPDGRVFAFAGESGVFVLAPVADDGIFADGFDAR